MEYWLVVAMVAVALAAVAIVFLTEADDEPEAPARPARPVIVLLGSAGVDPAAPVVDAWPDLLAAELADADLDDETTPDRLAATLPDALLADILADRPALVVLRLGADDLLVGTPLAAFEQELGRIARRLSPSAPLAIVALDDLASCAPAAPAEVIAQWSATIERIAVAVGAELIAWSATAPDDPPCVLAGDRVILTTAGHRALAAGVSALIARRVATADDANL